MNSVIAEFVKELRRNFGSQLGLVEARQHVDRLQVEV